MINCYMFYFLIEFNNKVLHDRKNKSYHLFNFTVTSGPVIKAASIKYIMIFRSVLPRDTVVASLPHIVRHLTTPSYVVHTYAACAIEKILSLRAADGSAM